MKFEILQGGALIDTKELGEGQFKIGRSEECEIRLKSPQVSKNHGLLVIKGEKAAVVDTGSSNGIFVNGVLVRKQRIDKKDVIDIADFQIRIAGALARPKATARPAPAVDGNAAVDMDYQPAETAAEQPPPPPDLSPQEKLQLVMDTKVLAPFYGLVKQYDWRFLLGGILLGALVLSVLLSVLPVVRWGKRITTKEAIQRAHAVIAQVVRENYRILSKTNDNTRLTVEVAEKAEGFLHTYIIDPSTKTIIAPAKYFNNTINDVYYQLTLKKLEEGTEEKVSTEKSDDVYVLAQRIPAVGAESLEDKSTFGPSAIVISEFSIPASITAIFEPLVEAILFATLLSLVAFFLISKMVSYPVQQMNEQIDAALKGENVPITCESKFPELETLATSINFTVGRALQGGGGLSQPVSGEDPEVEDEFYAKCVQEFDQGAGDALLLLDRDKKVRYVGRLLEDLIAMRNQTARGQNISDACRDAPFAGTCIDLSERVIQSIGETQNADLDINGVRRVVSAVGHKSVVGEVRLVLIVVKLGNES